MLKLDIDHVPVKIAANAKLGLVIPDLAQFLVKKHVASFLSSAMLWSKANGL
jgi:hypothetical protein